MNSEEKITPPTGLEVARRIAVGFDVPCKDRIAELERLLATAISIIKEIRPHDPQVIRSPYGLGTYLVDDEGAKGKRALVDGFLAEVEGIATLQVDGEMRFD